jgi:hypothetical protein
MPTVMIVASTTDGGDAGVFLAERVMSVQLADPHFAEQLIERLTWAGEDAEHAEREAAIRAPQIARPAATPTGR